MLKGSDSRIDINNNAENSNKCSNEAEHSTSHQEGVGSGSDSIGWNWTTIVNPLRLGAHYSFAISLHLLSISSIELQIERVSLDLLMEFHFPLLRAHSRMRISAEDFRRFWISALQVLHLLVKYSFMTDTCLSYMDGN